MAGTYPDVPGHRFMYDQDGSAVYVSPANASTPLSVIDAALLNDEDSDGFSYNTGASGQYRELTIVFPEARDVTGHWLRYTQDNGTSASTSAWVSYDTTDGTDGTWTSTTINTTTGAILPGARSNIQALTLTAVKGLRYRITQGASGTGSYSWRNLHIYGTIPVTANPDRLEFWQPAADSILDKAALDFGDMPLGSTKTKTFRIKNLSATKTATSTVVSANNLTGGAENTPMVDGMQFSLDGATWTASVTLPTLAPGATSGVISVRRVVQPNETATTRWARVIAVPTTYAV